MHWIEPLIAGVAVLCSSQIARSIGGTWGGIMAAAPITPTFAVLAMNRSPEALLQGLPVVAVTVVLIALAAGRRPSWYGAFFIWGWTGIALLAAWLVKAPNGAARGKGLSWPIRFLVGAGTIVLVSWSSHQAPFLAPYLAMAPWLFVAGVTAATLDGGKQAGKAVLQGGATGAVGVIGFVWAAALSAPHMANGWSLVVGWIGFALATGAWSFLRQRVQEKKEMGPPRFELES